MATHCPAPGRAKRTSRVASAKAPSTVAVRGRCQTRWVRTCEKAFHADQAAARLALTSILEKAARKGKSGPLPVRVYPCDVCDGWHLTTKPIRGREPPWDRDPNWLRPEGTAHLQQRSAEIVTGSRRHKTRPAQTHQAGRPLAGTTPEPVTS